MTVYQICQSLKRIGRNHCHDPVTQHLGTKCSSLSDDLSLLLVSTILPELQPKQYRPMTLNRTNILWYRACIQRQNATRKSQLLCRNCVLLHLHTGNAHCSHLSFPYKSTEVTSQMHILCISSSSSFMACNSGLRSAISRHHPPQRSQICCFW